MNIYDFLTLAFIASSGVKSIYDFYIMKRLERQEKKIRRHARIVLPHEVKATVHKLMPASKGTVRVKHKFMIQH